VTRKLKKDKLGDVRIAEVDLDKITPYENNPRVILEEAVDAVARSITDYGYTEPILVDHNGVIVTGHTRFLALKKLGWERVPVLISDRPIEELDEYRLADNKTGEYSAWNLPKLEIEMRLVDVEKLEPYFGEVALKSIMKSFVQSAPGGIPDEQFERYAQNRDSLFHNRSEAHQKELLDVVCSGCGEHFKVRRQDILMRPEEEETHG